MPTDPLLLDTVIGWVSEAVDGSIGQKPGPQSDWQRILDKAKKFEDDAGQPGRFTKAIFVSIQHHAWDNGKYFFTRFDLATMKTGELLGNNKRRPFQDVKDLSNYLLGHADQV